MSLTKPRICFLALLMAVLGYSVSSPEGIYWPHLLRALIGIGLVGASCGALNMVWEQDIDALMPRTRNRPLPAGRLHYSHALVLGVVTFVLGMAALWFWTDVLTAALGLATWVLYLFVYTPSKRISTLSTLIGAIPGAMPPLMGCTAATAKLTEEGLLLFGILFLWQVPHFLAIAWMYREDYARADLPILSVVDTEGSTTSRQILGYTLALLPLSLLPTLWGFTGAWYFFGTLLLGVLFLIYGGLLAVRRTRVQARKLFFVSLIYLPALGALWIWDRAPISF
jgi:heme o synthase